MATCGNSIFPIYFNHALTSEDAHNRLKLLEDYCNNQNGTSIKLIWIDEPNIYSRGLTKRTVAKRYLELVDREFICSLGNPTLAPVFIHPILHFGLGVFAEKLIPNGSYIMDYQGTMHWADDMDEENGRYAVEITVPPFAKQTGFALDAYSVGGIGRFLNHSCEPNTEATPVLINGLLRVVIMAIRDIQPNEHLCWCYGSDYFKERGIACFCGTRSCKIKPKSKRDKMDMFAYLKCIQLLGKTVQIGLVDQGSQWELIPQSQSPQPEASPDGQETSGGIVEEDAGPHVKSVTEIVPTSTTTSNSPAISPEVENNLAEDEDDVIEQAPMDRSREILKILFDADGIVQPDIKLISRDNITLSAHSAALSISSPVLHEMIENLKNKNNEPTSVGEGMIKLPQINAQTLRIILHWIYRDELPQNMGDHLEAVVKAAIYLEMGEMVKLLEKRLIAEFSLENLGELYLLAEQYQSVMPEALPKIMEFIQRDLEMTFTS